MRLSGNGQASLERSGTIVKAFRGFSAFLGPRKISIAPNQHRPLWGLREGWAALGLPCFLVRPPTSTPKPRAEGSSPSAPATKPAKTLGFRRFSFCMCCMAMVFTLVRTLGFLIWFYPSSTVLIPSSTRNAPDFGCFRMNSGASLFFCWFSGAKFSTSFLSTLPIWFTSRSRW